MSYLLDTNIVSAILRKNERVNARYKATLRRGRRVFMSGITYYEVKRGLLHSNATRKLADFEDLCDTIAILPVLSELSILEKASEIYADLKRRGRPIQDADILIAATAIANNLTLVSNDTDMQRVTEVTIENWVESRSS
mgnify:CR=1 FL=1